MPNLALSHCVNHCVNHLYILFCDPGLNGCQWPKNLIVFAVGWILSHKGYSWIAPQNVTFPIFKVEDCRPSGQVSTQLSERSVKVIIGYIRGHRGTDTAKKGVSSLLNNAAVIFLKINWRDDVRSSQLWKKKKLMTLKDSSINFGKIHF